jgi:hypothetical protein
VAPQPGGREFGWDSIFVPDSSQIPFSQMTLEDKCAQSHRGHAVRQWAEWLSRNVNVLWERQQGLEALGHKGLDFKQTNGEQR